MSIAINTIILFFIFLVPGLLFRRGYYSKAFSKQYTKTSSLDIFMSSIIPGVIIQIAYTLLVHNFIRTIDFGAFVNITSSNTAHFKKGVDVLIRDFTLISWFFLIQIFLSWTLGRVARKIIRKFRIDIKSKIFRFRNKWHYILSGEINSFPENILTQSQTEKIYFNTWVDVLVNVNSKTILYSGLLSDYHLFENGNGLEHIELISIRKKEFGGDNIDASIASDTMIIPYENVINLNLTYVEDDTKIEKSKANKLRKYKYINYTLVLFVFASLPLFFVDFFNFNVTKVYFESKGVLFQIITYLLFTHIIGSFMSVETNGKLTYHKTKSTWILTGIITFLLLLFMYLL